MAYVENLTITMSGKEYDKLIEVAAMHPHTNCSVCHGGPIKLSEEEQFKALLSAMRTSVQDTLSALKRKGYEIVKAE